MFELFGGIYDLFEFLLVFKGENHVISAGLYFVILDFIADDRVFILDDF